MQHGGQREYRSAQERGKRPQQDAKNDDGFEGDVGRIEVVNGQANPDAKGQRDAEESQQTNGLTGGAALGKQEPLKSQCSGSHRRNRGDDAQFDQQRDEDELAGSFTLLLYAGWTPSRYEALIELCH